MLVLCPDKKLYWVFPRPGPGAGGGEQKEVGLAVEKNLGSQVRKTWARNSRGRKNWSPAYPPNMQDPSNSRYKLSIYLSIFVSITVEGPVVTF